MIRILVVEDEKQISRTLELELTHEGYEVEVAETGIEAIEKFAKSKFSLAILDIMIPDLDGMKVCKHIKDKSDIPVIFLTAKDSLKDKVAGLDIGADDYLVKPFEIEELLARIRANLRKNHVADSSDIVIFDEITINRVSHEVTRNNNPVYLRRKEYELLLYFIKNPNKVITRDQILNDVWKLSYSENSNIIDVHIRHLREQIDDNYEKKYIHTSRGYGYIFKK